MQNIPVWGSGVLPVPTWLGDNPMWNSVPSTAHLTVRETERKGGNLGKNKERCLVKGKRFMRKDLKEKSGQIMTR